MEFFNFYKDYSRAPAINQAHNCKQRDKCVFSFLLYSLLTWVVHYTFHGDRRHLPPRELNVSLAEVFFTGGLILYDIVKNNSFLGSAQNEEFKNGTPATKW